MRARPAAPRPPPVTPLGARVRRDHRVRRLGGRGCGDEEPEDGGGGHPRRRRWDQALPSHQAQGQADLPPVAGADRRRVQAHRRAHEQMHQQRDQQGVRPHPVQLRLPQPPPLQGLQIQQWRRLRRRFRRGSSSNSEAWDRRDRGGFRVPPTWFGNSLGFSMMPNLKT